MSHLVQKQIVDRNGHPKKVWVSPDNTVPALSGRKVSAVPPQRTTSLSITSGDVENWIERNNLPLSNDEDFVDVINATILDRGDFTDSGFRKAYDDIFTANFGGYTAESLRAALNVTNAPVGTPDNPILSTDEAVQNGAVFDTVKYDDRVYHRARRGVYPSDVYSIRFQFNRELSPHEMKSARDLIAYAWAARVRGEGMSEVESDSPYSFIVSADSTKSRSDDVGVALSEWEDKSLEFLREGTKQKDVTLRISPVDPSLKVEFYYDNVFFAES